MIEYSVIEIQSRSMLGPTLIDFKKLNGLVWTTLNFR